MSSKQEGIRKGLEELYKAGRLNPVNTLFFLDKRDVVIKVDRELPEYVGTGNSSNLSDRLTIALAQEVQQDMLKAGYVVVEPLIKELVNA